MPFLDELAEHLKDEGVGVVGSTILLTSKSVLPPATNVGPFLMLRDTGGFFPLLIQNDVLGAGLERPGAILVSHAKDPNEARVQARRAYKACIKVNNRIVGDVMFTLAALTRVGAVATAQTSTPHRFITDMAVLIAGAGQAEYNGTHSITITGASTFTFPVVGSPATPATGVITAAFLGTFYQKIMPQHEPFDLGLDAADRVRYAFNVVAIKAPS